MSALGGPLVTPANPSGIIGFELAGRAGLDTIQNWQLLAQLEQGADGRPPAPRSSSRSCW